MRKLAGQALRRAGQALRRTGRMIRRVAEVALALAMLAGVALAVLSWRLASGPLDLPWLVPMLEEAANGADGTRSGGLRWSIGTAALAWEGFSGGVDRPFDLKLTDVSATTPDGQAFLRVPQVEVSLSIRQLLLGRVVPRAVELRGATLRMVRAADGRVVVDLGDVMTTGEGGPALTVTEILAELARPLGSDLIHGAAPLGQLERVLVREAALVLVDRRMATQWRAPAVMFDLRRSRAGGAEVIAEATLVLGGQTARLAARGRIDAEGVVLRGTASALRPALLAAELSGLEFLAAADLPVSLSGTVHLDTALALRDADLAAVLGAGTIAVARGAVRLAGGMIGLSGTPDALTLSRLAIDLVPSQGGAVTKVVGSGVLRREGAGVTAQLTLHGDRVAFADVAGLWPDGVGGKGAKPWVTGNMPAGIATGLHVKLAARMAADLSDLRLTELSGGFDGEGVTVHWLRPIPPLEQGRMRVDLVSPDVIEITVLDGKQAGIATQSGLVRISGLAERDQVLDVMVEGAGPLADVVAILRHPRLHLFDQRPIEMRDPAGQAKGRLEIIRLPLEDWITVDDVKLSASAKVTGARLGGVAGGRDLDQGNFDIQASNESLRAQGTARVAGIAAKLLVEMDFKPGPASQVIQTVTLGASADIKQIAALGLDLSDLLEGTAAVDATWRSRRDGRGEIGVKADLTAARMAVPRLNFVKPAGRAARAEVRVMLERARIGVIDRLLVTGEGVDVEAQIAFAEGKPRTVQVARAVLGRATNVRAEVQFPAQAGAPWRIVVSGASLDGTAELARRDPPAVPGDPPGPAYVLDAKLDRVVLAEGRALTQVAVRAESDGRVTRQARLTGRAGSGAFDVTIAPVPNGRTLAGNAADAGAFLRALDVVDDMQGGVLKLNGRYDDTRADHALVGQAEITDFRMTQAPALAKLLQAMTLYGLVEMVRGPGLGFSRLEAPFRLAGDALDITDARAFNASLGMTVKGRVDMATHRCDLQGTIVPAYFFNSLPGNIPLLGRLFSNERGGGLFATNYSLHGPCGDPAVTLNPLSALTPGFLRGLFGIFDSPAGSPAPAPAAPRQPGSGG